jgi:hypothetical protein
MDIQFFIRRKQFLSGKVGRIQGFKITFNGKKFFSLNY